MSHMFSVMCCKQTSYFEIFWGLSQDLQELLLSLLNAFSWMSNIHSFPPFLICFSFPFPLRLCICMPSSSRCIQGQHRPEVWSCSMSTHSMCSPQRQPASHQLQRWSDCAVSAYCVWWMKPYLHTLNFSTAVISFWQTLTVNVLSGGLRGRWWEDLARYFLIVNRQDVCLSSFKYWEPSNENYLIIWQLTLLNVSWVSPGPSSLVHSNSR